MNSVRAIAALFVLGATVWGATGCNPDSYGQPAAPTGPSVSPNAPDPLAAEAAGSAVDVSLGIAIFALPPRRADAGFPIGPPSLSGAGVRHPSGAPGPA